MPKYTKATARLKAKKLTKAYVRAGFNQSKLARQKGVPRSSVSEALKRSPAKDILQEFLDSPELEKKLIKVANEGLEAVDVVKRYAKDGTQLKKPITDPDHNIRHKFWHGCMTSKGKIKADGKSSSVKVINIVYGYRQPSDNTRTIRGR